MTRFSKLTYTYVLNVKFDQKSFTEFAILSDYPFCQPTLERKRKKIKRYIAEKVPTPSRIVIFESNLLAFLLKDTDAKARLRIDPLSNDLQC